MSSWEPSTGDATRDKVQSKLSSAIGNEGTRSRSIELAVRTEQALFERSGRHCSKRYKAAFRAMVKELGNGGEGFELNRKLLTGALAPEKWAADQIPEQQPLRVSKVAVAEEEDKEEDKPVAVRTSEAAEKKKKKKEKKDEAAEAAEAAAQSEREASPYYFFGTTPAEKAAQYAPKVIDPSKKKKKKEQEEDKNKGAAKISTWNKSGATWEERDLSKWARSALKRALTEPALVVPDFEDGSAAIDASAWNVTGDASVVYLRGKPRAGYDLKADTKITGSYKGESVSGKINMPNVEVTEGDDFDVDVTVSGASSEAATVVRRAVRNAEKEIRARVASFVAELRQQG